MGLKCGKKYLLVSCTYRSPSSNCENSLKEQEKNLMNETVNNIKFQYILHMDDVNYIEVNWDSNTTKAGINHVSTKFLNLVDDSFLFQHVKKTTRYRGEGTPSILDLVFTNENDMIDELEHGAPLGNSDHETLIFKFNFKFNHGKRSTDSMEDSKCYGTLQKGIKSRCSKL